jgi:hypothetical protein
VKSAPRSVSLLARNTIRDSRHPALDVYAKGLLQAIASRLNEDGQCWPEPETLRGDAGLSRTGCGIHESCSWIRQVTERPRF